MALLEMNNLKTFFTTKRGVVKAVNGVSYKVEAGKTLGVVGESGSGKSVSAMSMLKLLDGNGYIESGSIKFDGKELTTLPIHEMQKIRGNDISVIFQEPMTSLNPVFTIERQVAEPFIIHQGLSKEEARKKVVEMLADVKIPNPEVVARQYPHQLSGGMRQRVMIAMALACKPKLLIADEPTTALDVTIQAQILKLMNDLKREHGTSTCSSPMTSASSPRWRTTSPSCTVDRWWSWPRRARSSPRASSPIPTRRASWSPSPGWIPRRTRAWSPSPARCRIR